MGYDQVNGMMLDSRLTRISEAAKEQTHVQTHIRELRREQNME